MFYDVWIDRVRWCVLKVSIDDFQCKHCGTKFWSAGAAAKHSGSCAKPQNYLRDEAKPEHTARQPLPSDRIMIRKRIYAGRGRMREGPFGSLCVQPC
eukprot:3080042-Heterocapsa_arctica.AAC.1